MKVKSIVHPNVGKLGSYDESEFLSGSIDSADTMPKVVPTPTLVYTERDPNSAKNENVYNLVFYSVKKEKIVKKIRGG